MDVLLAYAVACKLTEKREFMIQITELTKKLGHFCLDGVTFSLPSGYIMGLVGPNGSGKTTLFHMLLGLYRKDAGELVIDGKSYPEDEKALHNEIGAVLQERRFEEHRTLQENGAFYGKYYENFNPAYFEELLIRFELEPERRYKALSKGEELKFQFAFALSYAPKLLLLDEPTGNFDPEFREEFFEVLKAFIDDGKHSVILATHLTQDLDRIADYITYLEKGKMKFSMDIERVHETWRLVTGERWQIRNLPGENVVAAEEGEFGTKALVRHHRRSNYEGLKVNIPSLEELMYFFALER